MKTQSSALVASYLGELERLLAPLDRGERQEVVDGVREHIEAALADTDGSEAATRAVLADVGAPQAVADEAYADRPGPARTSGLDRAWLPVVVVALQTIALIFLIGFVGGSAAVTGSSSVSGGSAGHVVREGMQTWNGSLGPALGGLLLTIWLWLPAWLLVALTGLWTSREKTAQVALVPVAALLLGGLPELGYRIWSFDGIPVGAWTGLGIVLLGGGVLLWTLTGRAVERAAAQR